MKKPYLRKLEQIGNFSVYEVDGEYVRNKMDIEFTNFGQHFRFKFIPTDEFWIDKEQDKNETDFFVDHMLVEYRLMKGGMSYDKAIVKADKLEQRERKKVSGLGKDVKPTDVADKARIKILTKQDGCDVWLVRGDVVRDMADIDFTEGGHDLVYKWIPKNNIWIDDDVKADERPFVLLHESVERRIMDKTGCEYHKAHREASKEEIEARKAAVTKHLPGKHDQQLHAGKHNEATPLSTEEEQAAIAKIRKDNPGLLEFFENVSAGDPSVSSYLIRQLAYDKTGDLLNRLKKVRETTWKFPVTFMDSSLSLGHGFVENLQPRPGDITLSVCYNDFDLHFDSAGDLQELWSDIQHEDDKDSAISRYEGYLQNAGGGKLELAGCWDLELADKHDLNIFLTPKTLRDSVVATLGKLAEDRDFTSGQRSKILETAIAVDNNKQEFDKRFETSMPNVQLGPNFMSSVVRSTGSLMSVDEYMDAVVKPGVGILPDLVIPVAEAVTDWVKSNRLRPPVLTKYVSAEVDKHLPGQHDQQHHSPRMPGQHNIDPSSSLLDRKVSLLKYFFRQDFGDRTSDIDKLDKAMDRDKVGDYVQRLEVVRQQANAIRIFFEPENVRGKFSTDDTNTIHIEYEDFTAELNGKPGEAVITVLGGEHTTNFVDTIRRSYNASEVTGSVLEKVEGFVSRIGGGTAWVLGVDDLGKIHDAGYSVSSEAWEVLEGLRNHYKEVNKDPSLNSWQHNQLESAVRRLTGSSAEAFEDSIYKQLHTNEDEAFIMPVPEFLNLEVTDEVGIPGVKFNYADMHEPDYTAVKVVPPAVLKHLPGQHNQSNHNSRQRVSLLVRVIKPKSVLYHGTTKDVLQSILKNGINPGLQNRRYDLLAYRGNDDVVHLSTDFNEALQWAKHASDTSGVPTNKAQIIVFEVVVPTRSTYVEPKGAKDRLKSTRMANKIPPECIKRYWDVSEINDETYKVNQVVEVKSLFDKLYTSVVVLDEPEVKHLPGQHDQLHHAGGRTKQNLQGSWDYQAMAEEEDIKYADLLLRRMAINQFYIGKEEDPYTILTSATMSSMMKTSKPLRDSFIKASNGLAIYYSAVQYRQRPEQQALSTEEKLSKEAMHYRPSIVLSDDMKTVDCLRVVADSNNVIIESGSDGTYNLTENRSTEDVETSEYYRHLDEFMSKHGGTLTVSGYGGLELMESKGYSIKITPLQVHKMVKSIIAYLSGMAEDAGLPRSSSALLNKRLKDPATEMRMSTALYDQLTDQNVVFPEGNSFQNYVDLSTYMDATYNDHDLTNLSFPVALIEDTYGHPEVHSHHVYRKTFQKPESGL